MADKQIDNTIIRLSRQHASGLTQDVITQELEEVAIDKVAESINRLLKQNRLQIHKDGSGKIVYKEVKAEEAEKLKGLNAEEVVVYRVIEGAGNMGIWSRDIKHRSGVPATSITKILKVLEGKKLIKSINSIASKNKKVYMLYHLEPHPDIVGDIWYSGQEIDAEFVKILSEACLGFIKKSEFATTEDVCAFIRKSSISKVELKPSNIQSIIDTLIYDGLVESVEDPNGPAFLEGRSSSGYAPTNLGPTHTGFTRMPCGTCPVFDQCTDDGDINPKTCVYYTEWLAW